jgi:hypothetical protein
MEKELRELERLLKADQQTGGAGTSTIKKEMRSVLRKLMEAYFNPLNGERRHGLYTFPHPPHTHRTRTRAACQAAAERRPDARTENVQI